MDEVAGSHDAARGPHDDSGGFALLTLSQRGVLELLAQGLAPKQAAWERRVAISTVRSHIAAAKRKTGARTLHQLVGAFVEHTLRQAAPGDASDADTQVAA
jgi:DNA-binding NarL/FixJ family response regulator